MNIQILGYSVPILVVAWIGYRLLSQISEDLQEKKIAKKLDSMGEQEKIDYIKTNQEELKKEMKRQRTWFEKLIIVIFCGILLSLLLLSIYLLFTI